MAASSGPALGALARQILRHELRWVIVVLLICNYAFFIDRATWNQSSRFALTRAVVEIQALHIDRDHAITGDKSFRDGHFYCDKAPGLSILAVPGYAAYYGLSKAVGADLPRVEAVEVDTASMGMAYQPPSPRDPKSVRPMVYNRAYHVGLYVARITTILPLALLGTFAFALLALALARGREKPALIATLFYALGTPAFVYGTAFYGHRPCADALIIAFAAIVFARREKHTKRMAWLAGTALGLAVCVEYPAAIPAALMWLWSLRTRGLKFALHMAAAGGIWALGLAAYHSIAFGHPFATGYDFVYLEHFAEGMGRAYGIALPDLAVLGELLWGRYRGLFYLSPVCILAAWACAVHRWGRPSQWPAYATWMLAVLVIYPFILNASYYMWDGGAALGPRHCVPALPFLCLGLVTAYERAPRLTLGLGAISCFNMLLASAGRPEAPRHSDPLWDHALPRLLADHSQNDLVHNLGQAMGLSGLWSLFPLLMPWLLVVTGRPAQQSSAPAIDDSPSSERS